MDLIITEDKPNPQFDIQEVRCDQLLAVVLRKLAPTGISITTADVRNLVSNDMLLMSITHMNYIDLKIVTKDEADIIINNGSQIGHS